MEAASGVPHQQHAERPTCSASHPTPTAPGFAGGGHHQQASVGLWDHSRQQQQLQPSACGAPHHQRLVLLWLYESAFHEDRIRTLMAQVASVADVIPVASVDEAGRVLDVNSGVRFIITPGGQWLHAAVQRNATRRGAPIIVFETCDAFTQQKYIEAGAAYVAPHVDILKDYLVKQGPAIDRLPLPFSPYRGPRTHSYGDQVVWPQIGSVVYSAATKSRYTITNTLGEGGYAYVYKCADFFGQTFVMKILKTFKPKHETEAEWQKEARFLLSLRHPNVIQIFDMFEFYGLYYLVVEECHGSLRNLVERTGPLPERDVIAIAGQMLSGLHHIHSNSVIHRDLQIDNVLYLRNEASPSQYQIKITDFGISKFNGQAGDMGLPAYTNVGRPYDVAPELIMAGYTTHQSDIYQLGLVLYYLYRGTSALGPEDGSSGQAIATGFARHRAESIGTPLGDCIARMLRRRVDWRFKDSVEVWTELCRVQCQEKPLMDPRPHLHHPEHAYPVLPQEQCAGETGQHNAAPDPLPAPAAADDEIPPANTAGSGQGETKASTFVQEARAITEEHDQDDAKQ